MCGELGDRVEVVEVEEGVVDDIGVEVVGVVVEEVVVASCLKVIMFIVSSSKS